MAWIELHQSLWTHKKTLILASLLQIDALYAAAHMSKFWTWALDNAQDGDISNLPKQVIAIGAGWQGDSDKFVQAAIQSGWLDDKDGFLVIHDWYDYAGRLIEKRESNKNRMRYARSKNDKECATHVQRTNNARAGATIPNLTIPNLTKDQKHMINDVDQNESDGAQSQSKTGKGKQASAEKSDRFLEFWSHYPRKVGKQRALAMWKRRIKKESPDTLIQAAKVYAAECELKATSQDYIKHASTFLSDKLDYLDYVRRGEFGEDRERDPTPTGDEKISYGYYDQFKGLYTIVSDLS